MPAKTGLRIFYFCTNFKLINMRVFTFAFAISLVMFTGLLGYAQVTTSGMNGLITSEQGERLPGATVLAIHQPSGTQYGTISNTEGRFNLQGMRPGGPYLVDISFVGYSKKSYANITLYLGESFVLDAALTESAVDLGEVMVVGTKASAFQTDKTGATTNISNEQMNYMPTINRSMTDIARFSPYANGMSFAGGDGRSSNLDRKSVV